MSSEHVHTERERFTVVFGATSAIAVAVARLLAIEGRNFVLVARNQEILERLAADLTVRGAKRCHVRVADLADDSAHGGLIEGIERDFGVIDSAILAWGVLENQEQLQSDFSGVKQLFQVNLLSPISLLEIVARSMESRRSGTIAVISSVAGDRGRMSNYMYGASKAGLTQYLEGLGNRLWHSGVHLLIIKPGFVDTPMTAHLSKRPLVAQPDDVARDIVRALKWKLPTVYTPVVWWPIMEIIRHLPSFVFRRLRL